MPHLREQPIHTSGSPDATLHIHRSNLTPEVRGYADNLRDQIRKIFADHGVKTVDEFSAAARAKSIPIEHVKEVHRLLARLHETVKTGEIPIDQERKDLQFWMQKIYDEIGIKTEVPLPPELTKEQRESFNKFGFRQFYIPEVAEDTYQNFFARPYWEEVLRTTDIERWPLRGQWVAMELIQQPNYNDPQGYPNDVLSRALHINSRFSQSWHNLHEDPDLLTEVANLVHQSIHNTRLPTVEEWNFLASLFRWLNNNKQENLPEIGTANSWEWTENVYGKDSKQRCIIGNREHHGASGIRAEDRTCRNIHVGFRVIVEL